MDKLKALMQRKVLGVPALYVVGLFVVILAVVAWKMKPAGDKEAAPDTGGESEGNPPLSGQPVFTSNPPPTYTTPTGDVSTTPDVDTNDKWLRRSIEWVSTHNNVPVDEATVALQAYLRGDQLTVRQGQIRDFAVAHFGLPPELPESGGTTPPPTPVPVPDGPPPKPTAHIPPGYHTVTGKGDDSYTEIAKLWYGRSDNATVDLLQSYNTQIGHAGPFKAGTRLFVPAYHAAKYIKATANMRTASQIIAKNPPLHRKMLDELNDGMKFPVAVGTRVRVA